MVPESDHDEPAPEELRVDLATQLITVLASCIAEPGENVALADEFEKRYAKPW